MKRREFCDLAESFGLQANPIHGENVRLKLDRDHVLRVSLSRNGSGVYGAYGVPAFPHATTGVLIPCVLHGLVDFTVPMDPIEALKPRLGPPVRTVVYDWTARREWVYASYQKLGGRCAYCGKRAPFKDVTLDHMTPYAQQGADEPANWAVSCKTCNFAKGGRTVEEYRASLGVPSFPLLEIR